MLEKVPFKSPIVWALAAGVIVIAFLLRPKSAPAQEAGSVSDYQSLAYQAASVNADRALEVARLNAEQENVRLGYNLRAYEATLDNQAANQSLTAQQVVALHTISNQTKVELDRINAEKGVALTGLDYSYRLGERQAEYAYRLGERQTEYAYNLGLGELDVESYRVETEGNVALDANRRAVELERARGEYMVQIAKATKKSAWDNFLGGLGGGLGGGVSGLLGRL